MKIATIAVGLVTVLWGSSCLAQDSLPGKYVGSFPVQTNRGQQEVGVTVVIQSVEEGKVKGIATLGGRGCAGDYPFEGTVKGDAIGLRATQKGGPAGDCNFGFKGKVEGNRLIGTMGKNEVELRK
jgi:hypothetical protein